MNILALYALIYLGMTIGCLIVYTFGYVRVTSQAFEKQDRVMGYIVGLIVYVIPANIQNAAIITAISATVTFLYNYNS